MNNVIQKWNEKYAGDDLVFGTTPNGFLVENSHLFPKGGHILAVGDGEGRNGLWLAEQGFNVTSIDGAPNAVRKARQQADQRHLSPNFQALCTDLEKWNWPIGKFDAVACLHLYFMPDQRPKMHQAMMNTLIEDGILVLEVFHPGHVGRGLGGPSLRELCYTAVDLASDFNRYKILHLEECEREIAPSTFHKGGQGKVSRIIVQKTKVAP